MEILELAGTRKVKEVVNIILRELERHAARWYRK
jgi:hypothetical protein